MDRRKNFSTASTPTSDWAAKQPQALNGIAVGRPMRYRSRRLNYVNYSYENSFCFDLPRDG